MGRIKIKDELKKGKLSVTITAENHAKFKELDITNKSKLINWLLQEHFGIEKGDNHEA